MKEMKRNGFTLVELLAVIVILAIILLIAVPNILGVIEGAREDSDISSAKMIATQGRYYALQTSIAAGSVDVDCDTLGVSVNEPSVAQTATFDATDVDSCSVTYTDGVVTHVTYGDQIVDEGVSTLDSVY